MVSMRKQSGFSLVELSIVLVILGLLVGGVLSGQALIRAAELRAVPTEAARYAAAVQTFRDKYFALPGDMPNATRFWVVNPGGCPLGGGTNGTCDGDGNGNIELLANSTTPNRSCEDTEVWKHLALAGLVEGQTETQTAANCYGVLTGGVHIPRSRFSGAFWEVINLPTPLSGTTLGTSGGTFFAPVAGQNVLVLGGATSSNHWFVSPPRLKSEEAWNIDTKQDDGQPHTGKVLTPRDTTTGGQNCIDETSVPRFELENSNSRCTLLFLGVFN